MKKAIFIASLLLLGCGASFGISSGDKPEFNKEREELIITVNVYKNRKQFLKAVPEPHDHLMGQVIYSKDDNECEIFILKSHGFDKTLGHEVMHCLYGDFHD